MAALFVDSSGWGNLVDPGEPFHGLATSIYAQSRRQPQRLVTTNYVVTELISLMASPLRITRNQIVGFVTGLKTSPFIEVVHVDPTLDEEAWQLFQARQDKDWDLVDCVSFVLMQKRGITEAITADHHFEQAGFVRLLK
jgi:predicted nucleic acid-binding protein